MHCLDTTIKSGIHERSLFEVNGAHIRVARGAGCRRLGLVATRGAAAQSTHHAMTTTPRCTKNLVLAITNYHIAPGLSIPRGYRLRLIYMKMCVYVCNQFSYPCVTLKHSSSTYVWY